MDDNPTVLGHDDPSHVRAVARLILEADAGTAAALEKAELAKEDVPPTWQIDPDDEGVDDVAEAVDRGRVAPGAADAVLSRAQEDIGGGKEQPSGSNCTTHTRWWDGTCFLWCAAALSYWFSQADASALVAATTSKGFVYTPSGAQWFQRNRRWGLTPQRGAVVFFRFHGDRIHHAGIVVGVNTDGSITTIEGNTSSGAAGSQRDGGGVYRRVRRSSIVGYGYPKYAQGDGDNAYPGPPPLKRGSRGPDVLLVQQALRMDYSSGPGTFGPKTEAAVKQFQGSVGLEVDGKVGPDTWKALFGK